MPCGFSGGKGGEKCSLLHILTAFSGIASVCAALCGERPPLLSILYVAYRVVFCGRQRSTAHTQKSSAASQRKMP